MTTDITHEDLIDLGYVCELAKSTDYKNAEKLWHDLF
jgi:hypothetical protein